MRTASRHADQLAHAHSIVSNAKSHAHRPHIIRAAAERIRMARAPRPAATVIQFPQAKLNRRAAEIDQVRRARNACIKPALVVFAVTVILTVGIARTAHHASLRHRRDPRAGRSAEGDVMKPTFEVRSAGRFSGKFFTPDMKSGGLPRWRGLSAFFANPSASSPAFRMSSVAIAQSRLSKFAMPAKEQKAVRISFCRHPSLSSLLPSNCFRCLSCKPVWQRHLPWSAINATLQSIPQPDRGFSSPIHRKVRRERDDPHPRPPRRCE